MTISALIRLLCFVVAAILLACLVRDWVKSAYRKGYQKGWAAAQEWIVTLETEVDRERQKIWREEAS